MALNTEAWEDSLSVFNSLFYTGNSENLVGLGNYRGDYTGTVAYNKNDFIRDENGQVFVCTFGTTGLAGPVGIPLSDTSKFTQIAFNDTTFKFREVKINGTDINSNGYPAGLQQSIIIPAGTMESGDVCVIEAWLAQNSGGSDGWAIFIDNQQLTPNMSNGNSPVRIRMVVIKYGNNGSGSPADLVGYFDHSNSGNAGLTRGTIGTRDTSGNIEVGLVKVSGSGNWRCEFYQAFVYSSTSS